MSIGEKTAYLENIQAGNVLVVNDDAFSCMDKHTCRTVRQDNQGNLFVNCNDGHHYLDGQLREDGSLAGLSIYQ